MLIENGDMTLDEYDEYLRGRSDFIRATKKDSSNARKVSDADVLRRLTLISFIIRFVVQDVMLQKLGSWSANDLGDLCD